MTTVGTGAGGRSADVAARPLGHHAALDGLRTVAVSAVMVFHNSWGDGAANWLPGGYLGVDVFFVLSGFLITTILLAGHAETGSTISRRFWYRRTRRLLPALILMLLIVAAFAAFRAPPWDLDAIRWRGIATALYVENWYAIIALPRPAPVSHAWSLSIEEQWYVIWPFMLGGIVAFARDRRRMLLGSLLALAMGSALVMGLDARADLMVRAYESTVGRAGELVIGGMLAVAVRRRPLAVTRSGGIAIELAGIAGAAWILWCFSAALETSRWMYFGGFYSIAVASALVILAAIQPTSSVIRPILAWRPLAAIGLISYGLYLFHIPIYAWFDPISTGLGPSALTLLRFAAVGAIAFASYRLIEQPFRRGAFTGRGHWLALGGTVGVILVLLAATVGGRAQRPWENQRELFAKYGAQVPSRTPRLLVVGEGDALALAVADRQATRTGGVAVAVVSTPTCSVAGNRTVTGELVAPPIRCDRWTDALTAGMAYEPDRVVLMAGTSAIVDHRVRGRTFRVGDPRYARLLTRNLDAARRTLAVPGSPLFVSTVTCPGLPDGDTSATATTLRDPARRVWVNQVWRRWAAAHGDAVRLVDLDDLLCPGGDTRPVGPDGPLRASNGALTRAGLDALRSWLVEQSGLAAR
ncbi:MAG: acyltransferase family protein [Actinomycetes bacterium]